MIRILVLGLLVVIAHIAIAQTTFPAKPLKLLCPCTPGTPPDVVGRIVGEQLAAQLGQPVVLEHRFGASGAIAMTALARAAPDGYTLGIVTGTVVVAPYLLPSVSYDPSRDFAPVALMARGHSVLVIPAGSALKSVEDLIEHAKVNPTRIRFSSAGVGTGPHLAGELFAREVGVKLVHVPYKGTAGLTALLAGEVDLAIIGTAVVNSAIQTGKLRALATLAPKRIESMSELRSMVELGYPDLQVTDWFGIVANAGAPKAEIDRLANEIVRALESQTVRSRMQSIGMVPAPLGSNEFAVLLRTESERLGKLVRDAGIRVE